MMRDSSLLLFIVIAFLATGCTPAKAPVPTPKIRVGKTTITNCPDQPPTFDADEAHISNVTDHTVDRICILGAASDESRAAIAHALTLHEGDKLDRSKVRDSLDALVNLKFLEDAALGADARGEDVVLYVVVRERARVDEVVFHGATVFGDAKLNEKNPIKKGAPVDRRLVTAVIHAMKEEYASVGYGSASIESSVEPSSQGPNLVIVRFTVNEGVQWIVRKLVFPGTTKITDADLKKITQISLGDVYDADRTARASLFINALYYDRGMLMVKVDEPKPEVALDGSTTLTWNITEGDVYRISAIKFGKVSATVPMPVEAKKQIKTKAGDVFDRSKLVTDITNVKTFLEAIGPKVDIEPLTEIDANKKTVEIVLNVDEAH